MNLRDTIQLQCDIEARDFSQKQRKKLAKTGAALPGGGFPIVNRQDLKNAERAIGRAKNPGAARAHIRDRAKALHVNLTSKWKKNVDAFRPMPPGTTGMGVNNVPTPAPGAKILGKSKKKRLAAAETITNPSNPASFGPRGDMGPAKALDPA